MQQATRLALAVILICGLAVHGFCQGQAPRDPADALRNMFEKFAEQSEQFAPGMLSELTPQQMANLERIKISPREESQFGDEVLKNYEASLRTQKMTLTRQGDDVKYLSALVMDIRPLMKNAQRYPRIDVVLVSSDETDAYSVPGGHLVFTKGLLQTAQSEAELVGVISHELSHLDHGHQLLALKQSKNMPQMNDARSSMLWMATMFKPFRAEFEAQADADAVRWMLAAGYDPRELSNLLARWDVRQDKQAGWTKMLPNFARSHPDAGRRAQSVLDDFKKISPKKSKQLIIGRQNLAKRIPSSQRKLID